MKLITRLALLLITGLMAVNCSIIAPEPENSCNFVQNHEEQRVSWKSNLPIKFRVHKDFPREAIPSILEAAKSWNSVSTINLIEFVDFEAEGTPASSYADGTPMIFWKLDWEENKTSEQARSIIAWKGATIRDADIWINAKNFTFTYLDQPFHPFKVDLVSLFVHEMGHTLGLEHNSNEESVMYARLRRGYDRREIDHLGDLESFGCEYGEEVVNQDSVMALINKQADDAVDRTSTTSIVTSHSGHNHGRGEESELASSVNNTSSGI